MKYNWYSVPPRILLTIAWVPSRWLVRFFCHFQVCGKKNLTGLRQAIFACNHASEFDPVLLAAALSPLGPFAPLFFVTAPIGTFKDKGFGLRRHVYTSTFFKMLGAYPINAGLHDYAKTLKDYIQILKDGGSVCIFPEGAITKTGELGEAHGGAAFLSSVAGVPIVPTALKGTFNITPREFIKRYRSISVTFGEPQFPALLPVGVPQTVDMYRHRAQTIMDTVGLMLKSG